jgi:hypothetical protein
MRHAMPALLMAVVVPFLWLDPALFAPAIPAASGMVIAIDPETGLPTMPTPEQIRALFPAGTIVQQTSEGFVVEQRADGAVLVHVGSALQEYSFARIGPDGKLVWGCASAHGVHGLTEIPGIRPAFEEK